MTASHSLSLSRYLLKDRQPRVWDDLVNELGIRFQTRGFLGTFERSIALEHVSCGSFEICVGGTFTSLKPLSKTKS